MSGAVALGGALLFGIVGLGFVLAGDRLAPPHMDTATQAGHTLETFPSDVVAWGSGEDLRPDEVQCIVTSVDEPDGVTVPASWSGERQQKSSDARTFVVLTDLSDYRLSYFTCSGGGLETFATGPSNDGLRGWKFGVFLLVFAGVAALWAGLVGAITRRTGERA
ncbi:hypothetical protein [Antribacter gilvus]|uniref:hypothetical protein n=1 Tax=Antribacter gilvus TaxID=2304675 RepID=UPI000F7A38B2|nr:hypothetical protein [Antribacter gilvus]